MYNHAEFIAQKSKRYNDSEGRVRDLGNGTVLVIQYNPDFDTTPEEMGVDDEDRLHDYYADQWSYICVDCVLYHKGYEVGAQGSLGVEDDSPQEYINDIVNGNLDQIRAYFAENKQWHIDHLNDQLEAIRTLVLE